MIYLKKKSFGTDATVYRQCCEKNKFEEIFQHAITILHHYLGKTFPLPGALYITGNHIIESVRYFIMCLREKERSLFSKKVQPHMIIVAK